MIEVKRGGEHQASKISEVLALFTQPKTAGPTMSDVFYGRVTMATTQSRHILM